MARLYGLPSHCIVSADSKLTDIQLAIEKYSALLIAVLSGINLIHGSVCQSDGMNGANFEQILIDNEIISMIKHMMDAFHPDQWESDTSEIFEDIRKSLTSGMYFMESDTTLRDFKKRLWMSDLLIRQNFDRWQAEGMRSIIDNSISRTRDILKNHKVEPLDRSVKKELEQIAGV